MLSISGDDDARSGTQADWSYITTLLLVLYDGPAEPAWYVNCYAGGLLVYWL